DYSFHLTKNVLVNVNNRIEGRVDVYPKPNSTRNNGEPRMQLEEETKKLTRTPKQYHPTRTVDGWSVRRGVGPDGVGD
ncbi:MAG: hypothetical protein ACREA9_02135, partial [Pyrinomonadaceae bacterium]